MVVLNGYIKMSLELSDGLKWLFNELIHYIFQVLNFTPTKAYSAGSMQMRLARLKVMQSLHPSTSKMGAVITYQDNAGTNALNTDINKKLSADNGSNYSTATLTALPDFATGIKMAKVNDLSVTAGTQLKYQLNFANQAAGSKEARIRGVSLQY